MYKFYQLPRFVVLIAFFCCNNPANRAESTSGKIEVEQVTLSAQEIDREIATGKKYEYTVTADGFLVDSKGRTIEPRDFKKYLKKEKCDNRAYFVLWIAVKNLSPDKLAPIVSSLADYGVENVVLRRKVPSGVAVQANEAKTPATGEGISATKKVKIIKGNPNPQAITATDPFPALDHRPDLLRPQRLPAHVRYVFATDEVVTAAADRITRHLLSETPADGTLFGATVLVNAGAWLQFRNNEAIGHNGAKPMTAHGELNHKTLTLDGMVLTNPEEISSLEKALKNIVNDSGGSIVRALRTYEMEKLWTFIAFDIEEPVFVVETNDKRFRFILVFNNDRLFSIDELNGLPDN